MSDLLDAVSRYGKHVFGDSEKGISISGIAATAIGGAAGFWLGGIGGSLAGLLVGTALGSVVNSMLEPATPDGLPRTQSTRTPTTERERTVSKEFSSVAPMVYKRPHEVNTTPKAIPTSKMDIALGGDHIAVSLPNEPELTLPWGDSPVSAYIDRVRADTLSVLTGPETRKQSPELLRNQIVARNEPFYQHLSTVYHYHQTLKEYNTTQRPQIMQKLGLDNEHNILGHPPTYDLELDFTLPKGNALETDARAHLGIPADAWNALNPVERLAKVEESMNARMLDVSTRTANLNGQMERFENSQPFDLDFSLGTFTDRLSWASFGLISDTYKTRTEHALNDYYLGTAEEQQEFNGKTVIERDEEAAEKRFQSAMDSIISDSSAKGHFQGDTAAALMRERVALMIEERKVRNQWNGVMAGKQMWANESQQWLEQSREFRTELETFSAQYADNARVNKDFAIVHEEAVQITAHADNMRQMRETRQEVVRSNAAMRAALNGVGPMLEQMDADSLNGLTPIDIASINALPDADEFMGRERAKAPKAHSLDGVPDLRTAAEHYNKNLKAFSDNRTDKARAHLSVSRDSFIRAIENYMRGANAIHDGANEAWENRLNRLQTEGNQGTDLAGTKGFALYTVDKRAGKNQIITLRGIKKDGVYTVTGVSRSQPDGSLGEVHDFGSSMIDTDAGLVLNLKTLEGMDAIIKKIDQMPAATRESKKESDGFMIPLEDIPTKAPAAAPTKTASKTEPDSVLQQALASVDFTPMPDKSKVQTLPTQPENTANPLAGKPTSIT